MLFSAVLLFVLTLVGAKNEKNEGKYLRKISNNMNLEGWKSFPTPGPKKVKSNPNAKCTLQTFGRCNPGEYCKGIGYDKYQCTTCPRDKKCTGDGKMGPPR